MPARERRPFTLVEHHRRLDEMSDASRGAASNDVNMLVFTGDRQCSEQEFRSAYHANGFTLARIVPAPARVGVIEGRRA
jgi:hypothetical protein